LHVNNVENAFKKTLAVIDRSFLKTIPHGSEFGTVESFMQNLVAMAVRLHLETTLKMITKEETANYVYSLDSKTDNENWVAPLDPFIGPDVHAI